MYSFTYCNVCGSYLVKNFDIIFVMEYKSQVKTYLQDKYKTYKKRDAFHARFCTLKITRFTGFLARNKQVMQISCKKWTFYRQLTYGENFFSFTIVQIRAC